MVDTLGKPAWRSRLLAARAQLTRDALDAAATALAEHVSGLRGTVCAYRPVGAEPGASPGTPEHDGPGAGDRLLLALLDAGCRVLLPVVVRRRPMEWAEYTGPSCLEPAAFGLLEPTGPRLGPAAVLAADTVLVPALAVDRSGVRLGRGGGYYDRSLPGARGRLVAVVHDSELVDALPRDPHDVLMTATLTPSLGVTAV